MRVLIVRLSSMGDLVQTLPAITDANHARPDITFDWVADEAFADVPRMHPAIEKVIPSSFRRFRKGWGNAFRSGEAQSFMRNLREHRYDLVVDIQGEFKSALAAMLAQGPRYGYVGSDVHEWGAHLTYGKRFAVPKGEHSILRMRKLLASVLKYEFDPDTLDYGIERSRLPTVQLEIEQPYLVFIHSTSWTSKNWPIDHWRRLIQSAREGGYNIVLPWGSEAELLRSQELAGEDKGIIVLPQMSIAQKASVIAGSAGSVGLDTGLSHISAALGIPSVTAYGATDPALVAALGKDQVHVVPDFRCLYCHQTTCRLEGIEREEPACLNTLSGTEVWQQLSNLLPTRGR
ncbi:MAG: lipopolysaccharide heptosyltransferase I [Pyrinomonadaceae bacterium]